MGEPIKLRTTADRKEAGRINGEDTIRQVARFEVETPREGIQEMDAHLTAEPKNLKFVAIHEKRILKEVKEEVGSTCRMKINDTYFY